MFRAASHFAKSKFGQGPFFIPMKRPYIQFYTGDWLKDPQLSFCSPATRGVWIDFLCAMHELDQGGKISGTVVQLARIARSTPQELEQAIDELKANQVADVTLCNGIVTLVNRRMKREHNNRNGSRLRVSNARAKASCNADVTQLFPSEDEVEGENGELDLGGGVGEGDGDAPFGVPIPKNIDTPEFRSLWDEWIDDRKSRKKSMTAAAARRQLSDLSGLGIAGAIASINQSIKNGWAGLFEARNGNGHNGNGNGNGFHPADSREIKENLSPPMLKPILVK